MKNSKLKIYKYHNDVYPRTVYVCFNPTEKQINDNFGYTEDSSCHLTGLDKNSFGCTYGSLFNRIDDRLGVLVAFNGKPAIDEIAHEATHVLDEIMSDLGLEYVPNNNANEHMAYLMQWIVRSINDAVTAEYSKKKKSK